MIANDIFGSNQLWGNRSNMKTTYMGHMDLTLTPFTFCPTFQ